ncbi:MAG: PEP-CTERM sorting domain-containing protein [Planctomycetota bacterium]
MSARFPRIAAAAVVLIFAAAGSEVRADLVAGINLDNFNTPLGSNPGPRSASTALFGTTDPLLNDVVLSIGPGYSVGNQDGFLRTGGNESVPVSAAAVTPATDTYFSFTLAPTAGAQLTLDATDSITATMRRYGGDADTGFALRSSLDGFTSNVAVATPFATGQNQSFAFDVGSGFQNLVGPVEFRGYIFNPSGSDIGFAFRESLLFNNDDGLNDFAVFGTLTAAAVPEPSAVLLVTLGLAAAPLARRRRRADALPAQSV